ncbi:MAG: hypothetical protein ACKVS8_02245 [Phycisphaerales bacterium]
MTTHRLLVIAGLALSLSALGCEEKKAETTKAGAAATKMADTISDAAAKASDGGKAAAAKALATVSDEIRTAAQGYVDSLTDAGKTLFSVHDASDASKAKPLAEAITKNAGFAAILEKTTPDMKEALKGTFEAPLAAATQMFTEQKDRIMKDPTLSKIFGDTLAKFKSFSL